MRLHPSIAGSMASGPVGCASHNELIDRWRAWREQFGDVDARVSATRIIDHFIDDLQALEHARGETLLSLTEAATLSGYSREHLGRLVRDGPIPNAGRQGAPKIRRRDVPMKSGGLPSADDQQRLPDSRKGDVVRSVVAQAKGTR